MNAKTNPSKYGFKASAKPFHAAASEKPAPPRPKTGRACVGDYVGALSDYRAEPGEVPPPTLPGDPEAAFAEDAAATRPDDTETLRLGEALDLAVQIADDAARDDIQARCRAVRIGGERNGDDWFDLSTACAIDATDVARADRYLQLRGPVAHGYRVVYNPAFPRLIRFDDSRRFCRACGCTDHRACAGGCSWVAPDLCSKCQEPQP